jgi:hypothetical protein
VIDARKSKLTGPLTNNLGVIQVQSSNIAGDSSKRLNVSFLIPPNITILDKLLPFYDPYTPLSVKFRVAGFPRPNFKCFMCLEPSCDSLSFAPACKVTDSPDFILSQSVYYYDYFGCKFDQLTLENGGMYLCTAENIANITKLNFKLTIVGKFTVVILIS